MTAEVESMMYVGETPWHGLGTRLEEPPTAAEAIEAAGLDWDVKKYPVFVDTNGAELGDGGNGVLDFAGHEPIPGTFAVTRETDNRVFSVVSDYYEPLQNRVAFEWFDPFIKDGLAEYHTAGSLKGGSTVWVLARLKGDPLVIAKGDEVEKFLLLSNGHDGHRAVSVRFTPTRVVCWNTLSMAEGASTASFVKVYHSGKIVENMAKVQEIVNITNESFEETADLYRLLAGKQVKNVEKYVLKVLGFEKNPEKPDQRPYALPKIMEAIEEGPGADNPAIRGSLWWAYNGITYFIDHQRGLESTRLDSAWFGDGQRVKQRALEHATVAAARS